MIQIQAKDYDNLKSIAALFSPRRAPTFYMQKPPPTLAEPGCFAIVVATEQALISVRLSEKPPSFDQDFHDALEVAGLTAGG